VRFGLLAGLDAAQFDLFAPQLGEYGTYQIGLMSFQVSLVFLEMRFEVYLTIFTDPCLLPVMTGQILEILLPVALVYILVAIKMATENAGTFESDLVPAKFPSVAIQPLTFTDYVTALRARRMCVAMDTYNEYSIDYENTDADFVISGLNPKATNWQVPLVKCDSTCCTRHGENALPFCEFSIVALTGTDPGGMRRALQFKFYVETTYPSILSANEMPMNFSLLQVFQSSKAMDDYIQRSAYGTFAAPKIAMGIVWDGDNTTNYAYHLRPNSTNFNSPDLAEHYSARTTPDTGQLVDSFAKDDESVCPPIFGATPQGPFQDSCTGQYLYNGVLTFQRLVNDFILFDSGAAALGYKVSEAGVQFTSFPTKQYTSSGFFDEIQGTPCVRTHKAASCLRNRRRIPTNANSL
jgi:hypothetical protein